MQWIYRLGTREITERDMEDENMAGFGGQLGTIYVEGGVGYLRIGVMEGNEVLLGNLGVQYGIGHSQVR